MKHYFHVTERSSAEDIIANGFFGGWGDVGFGVYFYGNPFEAAQYAASGGWDDRLTDPVVLEVVDASIEKVTDIDPSWNPDKYADMWWRPMDDEDEDARWRPEQIAMSSR